MIYSRLIVLLLLLHVCGAVANAQQPNVIFILTDDQGYGDLGCHGNPWLKTPNIDALHASSARYTNFHVGTTCAPTRAGLMTGKYCNKVGVWHTVRGREILRRREVTMAEIFKKAGYTTGIFGKWHLGDHYPFRPQDRGFDEVLVHRAGGVGQTPDYWNNNYFDDTYLHNGKEQQYPGYCTDVWFTQAEQFIKQSRKRPFFCFISTNSPHDPTYVDRKYSAPYENNPSIVSAAFYAMIANIDERVGQLIATLKKEGLYENTIIIFMTDNGTAGGAQLDARGDLLKGYNAGMRGRKVSPYEGGHRVPFFVHWEAGGINKGQDINALTSYVDVLPTLMNLCGIKSTDAPALDGLNTKPLLANDPTQFANRVIFSDTQRGERLEKGRNASVMKGNWRLVFGKELYDVEKDPGQHTDVATQNPTVVAELTSAYEQWWADVSKHADEYSRSMIGAAQEPVSCLTAHDLHVEGKEEPSWSQVTVRKGEGPNGFWAVEVAQSGRYEIELRRYPAESKLALGASAPPNEQVYGAPPYPAGVAINFTNAVLKLDKTTYRQKVDNKALGVRFVQQLKKGPLTLSTEMTDAAGVVRPAYYVYVRRLN